MAPRAQGKRQAEASTPRETGRNVRRPAAESSFASDVSIGTNQVKQLDALQEIKLAMEKSEKKDTFIRDFDKRITQEEKRLLELLAEQKAEIERQDHEFNTTFASLASAALTPTDTKWARDDRQSRALLGDLSPDKQPLYDKCSSLMDYASSLITQHDDLETLTTNIETLPDLKDIWQRDCDETRRIIKIGAQASQMEIDRLLAYKAHHQPASRPHGSNQTTAFERDEHLQVMLELGRSETKDKGNRPKRKPRGWGNMARGIEKGMKVLTKALPSSDDTTYAT